MNRSAAGLFPCALGVWGATVLACAVFVITSAHPAQAGINVWTSHGPQVGVQVTALAVDAVTPTTLYAGSSNFGLIKSTDGGAIWATANTGLPVSTRVNALAIDPHTPSTLYTIARATSLAFSASALQVRRETIHRKAFSSCVGEFE